jgi:hypothetical protein
MDMTRSRPKARLLLGLLLLLVVFSPLCVLADDVLLAWGSHPFGSAGHSPSPVPTRVVVSRSGIRSAVAFEENGVALIERDGSLSVWSAERPHLWPVRQPIEVGPRTLQVDLSPALPFLPSEIAQFASRETDAFVLNRFGELWTWDRFNAEPVRVNYSAFHTLSEFVDSRFRSIKCAIKSCILHGTSGRFYASSAGGAGLFDNTYDIFGDFSTFAEFDLSIVNVRTPITMWTMHQDRFSFVNGSTQVWELGLLNDFGDAPTFTPVLMLDTTQGWNNAAITHIAISKDASLVYTTEKDAIYWNIGGSSNGYGYEPLDELLYEQFEQFNNGLKQMVASRWAYWFLMEDGQLFYTRNVGLSVSDPVRRRVRDIYYSHGDITGSVHSSQLASETILPVHVGAVPLSHKIESLSVSYGTTYDTVVAVAKPRTEADASRPIELVDPVDSGLSTVVSWGRISPMLGTGWAGHADGPETIGTQAVQNTHLPLHLREIKKVASANSVMVALTASGTVLTWGCGEQSSEACWHASPLQPQSDYLSDSYSSMPPLSVPIPLDPAFHNHSVIVDISVGRRSVALLTDAGQVFFWNILQLAKKRDLSDDGDADYTGKQKVHQRRLDPGPGPAGGSLANWNSVQVLEGVYAHVWLGGYSMILEDAVNHRLQAWSLEDYESGLETVLESYEILLFDNTPISSNFAFVGRDIVNGQYDLMMTIGTMSSCPGSTFQIYCNLTSVSPVPVSEIRKILVFDSSTVLVLLTDGGLYYLGPGTTASGGLTFDNFGLLPYQLPVPAAQIVKMAFLQDVIGLLTTSGDIYVQSVPDTYDVGLPMIDDHGNFSLLRSDFVFSDLSSHQFAFRGSPKFAIGVPRTPSSAPTPSSNPDALSSLFIGQDLFCTSGLETCGSASFDEPLELDAGHPLNSPTATQISLGYVASVVDGRYPSGLQANLYNPYIGEEELVKLYPVHRTLRWGAMTRSDTVGTTRYQQVTYQEPSIFVNETAFEAANVNLVKTVSVGLTQISIYSNCSLAVQFYSDEGPVGQEGEKRSTWPNSGDIGPPQLVFDAGYPRRAAKEFFLTDHVPMDEFISYGTCGGADAPVEDIQCSVSSKYQVGRGGAPLICNIRAGSRLFGLALSMDAGIPCDSALLGSPDDCYPNAPSTVDGSNIYGLVEIDTTSASSAFSDKRAVQYRLGIAHAVALASDGSVVAWGSNDLGQLGLERIIPELPPLSSPVDPLRKASSQHRRSESEIDSYTLGVPSQVPIPGFNNNGRKVFASAFASFVLTHDHLIFGWGDNFYGMLGRGKADPYGDDEERTPYLPDRVKLPYGVIQDAECTFMSCYALYKSGKIYSWGGTSAGLLGRETPRLLPFDPMPREAKKLKFKDPSKMVQELFVGPGMVVLRGKTAMPPPEPVCETAAPSADFVCIEGVWTSGQSIEIERTDDGKPAMIIGGPTKIVGNLTVPAGESFVIVISDFDTVFADPGKPIVTVTGCFEGGGEIEFKFEPRAWAKFKNQGNGKQLTTIESSCQMQGDGIKKIQAVDAPPTCHKASATGVGTNRDSGRFGLQSTFTLNNSRCTRWWMILLCVIAAVVIICLVVALVHRIRKTKASQASSQRIRTSSVRAN